jgi:hypothetical protein
MHTFGYGALDFREHIFGGRVFARRARGAGLMESGAIERHVVPVLFRMTRVFMSSRA